MASRAVIPWSSFVSGRAVVRSEVIDVLIAIIVMAVAMLITAWAILGLDKFRWELKRLNMEIARTTGEEQKEWRALRRKLWLSLLPFFKY